MVKKLVPSEKQRKNLKPFPKEHVEKYMLLTQLFHYRDHTSKHSFLEFLRTKEASGVAYSLSKAMHYFGAPVVLQSDNGKEFVAEVVKSLAEVKKVCFIQAHTPHPQTIHSHAQTRNTQHTHNSYTRTTNRDGRITRSPRAVWNSPMARRRTSSTPSAPNTDSL